MSRTKDSKIRFGILDAVIIIIILAIAASLILRYTVDNSLFTYDTDKYSVTFKACGLRYTSVDSVASATDFYMENGALLGKLKHAPTVTPKVEYVTVQSGEIVACYYPDNTLVDIIAEIECDLIDKDGSVMTKNGVHIVPGVELTIHTEYVEIAIEIINVQKLTAE